MRTLRVVAVIRGIGPIFWMVDKPVFDGIDPAILDVVPQIFIVSDMMLPKPPLPQSVFPSVFVACAARGGWHGAGEAGFDHAPPGREIAIPFRQRPDAMHVVGQDHPGVDGKGANRAGLLHGGAQGVDLAGQGIGAALGEVDREEHGRSGFLGAQVIGHRLRVAESG